MTVSHGDLIWLDGLFVGSLDDHDRDLVARAMEEGKARLVYEGVGGLLGLARVQHLPSGPPTDAEQREVIAQVEGEGSWDEQGSPAMNEELREAVARIVDPHEWAAYDLHCQHAPGGRPRTPQDTYCRSSLAKADAILALISPDKALLDEKAAWDWLATRENLELDFDWPDEADEGAWRVHRVTGNRNDREWDLIGTGETPLKAVLAARLLTETEKKDGPSVANSAGAALRPCAGDAQRKSEGEN